jgi:PAS domain S-box-containing protein
MNPEEQAATLAQLQRENEALHAQLAEAHETIEAMRNNTSPSLAVSGNPDAPVYSVPESEHLYRLLVEQMSEGAATLTTDGIILYANQRLGKMLNAAPERLTGSSLFTWLAPSEHEQVQSLLRQADTRRNRVEAVLRRHDEALLPASLSVARLEAQALPVISLVASDLSEQKRREDALRASEARFRTIYNTSPDAIGVFDINANILMMNPAAANVFGYSSSEEMVGHNALEFFLPPEREKAAQVISQIITDGVVRNVEFELLRKDGSHFTAEFSCSALYGAEAKPEGILAITRDITERKQVEQSLRESEEKYRRLVELSPVAVAIQVEGKIEMANAAGVRMFGGTSEKDFIGRNIFEFIHPDWVEPIRQRMLETLKSGMPAPQSEMVFIKLDGQEFHALSSGAPIQYQGKRAVLISVVDITELTKIKKNLLESEQKFATAFEISPVGMLISRRSDGVFLEVNEELMRISGYSRAEWLGQSSVKMGLFADPELREKLAEQGVLRDVELQVKHKSGQWRWVSLSTQKITVQGEECFLVVIRDIHGEKQFEDEKRQSEAKFRALLYNSPLQSVIWKFIRDAQGTIIDWEIVDINPRGAASIGLEINTALGRRALDLFGAEAMASYLELSSQIDATGQTIQFETHFPSNNRHYWSSDFLLGNDLYANISMDITDLKTAQAEIENLARFPAENPTPVLRLDQAGTILYANAASAALLGDWGCKAGERAPAFWQEQIASALAQQKSRLLDYDCGEIIYSANIVPFPEAGYVNLYMTDITQRKRAEDLLRESEERNSKLIEFSPAAMIVFGDDGIQQFNRKAVELFGGKSSAEFLGKSVLDMVHPDFRERALERIRLAREMDLPALPVEVVFLRLDGQPFYVISNGVPLQFHGKKVYVVSFLDITERKRVEEALRASEEKYRVLMESIDNAVAILDHDGRFLYMNINMAEWLDDTPQAFIGKTLFDAFPEEMAKRQMEDTRRVFQEDKGRIIEELLPLPGGMRWKRTSLQPIHDQQGRVTSMLVNSVDIHDLKTLQHELQELNHTLEERVRERAAQVQDLYDNAPVGYQSIDRDGRIIAVNQTELNWLGYTHEEMLGKPATEFFTEQGKTIFAESFSRFKATGSLTNLEFESVRKDGTTFPVSVSATAIYDAEGNYLASRTTLVDITERKRAETALRESEAQNRLLFEESPVAVTLLNAAGVITRINRAYEELTGFTSGQILGRTARELGLLPSSGYDQLRDALLQPTLESRSPIPIEYTLTRADSILLEVESRIYRFSLEGVEHILVTTIDITSFKKAEELLRQANSEMERAMRLKDDFLANMSHELRTPLTGILGITEILLEQNFGPLNERQGKYLQLIDSSGHHLLSLINDILDLTKIESGKIDLELEMLNVKELCQACLVFIREPAQTKHITLKSHYEPETLRMLADVRRLKQILVNLLGNAVKFTPAEGQISLTVSADVQSAQITFVVADTGIGISPLDIPRLFTPFTQVDSSLSRRHEGTGLGLSLVKQLAELHGGKVSVDSEVGKGSRFSVVLPWRQSLVKTTPIQPNTALPQESVTVSTPVTSVRKRILLADDNADNAEIVQDYLIHAGYEVICAENGNQVLALVQHFHPDLILMDIQMPGLDGLEVTRRLRKMPEFQTTPIIALTALAMTGDRELCKEAGATEYMSKPFSLKELAAMVETLLSDGK